MSCAVRNSTRLSHAGVQMLERANPGGAELREVPEIAQGVPERGTEKQYQRIPHPCRECRYYRANASVGGAPDSSGTLSINSSCAGTRLCTPTARSRFGLRGWLASRKLPASNWARRYLSSRLRRINVSNPHH